MNDVGTFDVDVQPALPPGLHVVEWAEYGVKHNKICAAFVFSNIENIIPHYVIINKCNDDKTS